MKKYILILSAVLLFTISVYTVVNYNKKNNTFVQNSNGINTKSSTLENSSNKSASSNLASSTKVKATDFKLKDLNGKEVSLSDFKGKKVFLNFWATWCPPCKAEMPDIEKFYQETKDSNLVILAVNLGEDKQTVKSFIDKNKYNFNILLDSNQDVAVKYNIVSIPTSFFIDKDGNIVSKKIGAMSIEEMKSYVNSLNN
jgi:thiol-disulfide isomerase/thioredoxin